MNHEPLVTITLNEYMALTELHKKANEEPFFVLNSTTGESRVIARSEIRFWSWVVFDSSNEMEKYRVKHNIKYPDNGK